MRKMLILIITLGFILIPFSLQASIYGTIKGKVVDEEGKPLVGASVFVEGTRLGAFVKSDGRFSIVNVNPGEHTIKVTFVGYSDYKTKVRVSADVITEIDVKMKVAGKTTEEIVIVANKVMVENTKIGDQQKFQSEDLVNIARDNVQDIVGFSAGVFNTGDGYNIRGARASETQIRVDGLDVGNQFQGGFGLVGRAYYPMVSTFATEEVQVLTGGFSAEYGDATGGVVNTVVKSGRTDRYEGFLRWKTDVPALWGSQENGIKLVREGQYLKAYNSGEGKQLQGPNENTIEFGGGGPLPYLNKSTFYISGKYFYEKYRNYNYEVYDPLGNNVGQMPNNQSWTKNVTGRLKFALTNDIDFIVGGSFGMTNMERMGWTWLYADNGGGIEGLASYGVPEYISKLSVANQTVSNAMLRVTHRLSQNSFYELTLSNTTNNDEFSKRTNYDDPDFFGGFDLWYPQDNYQVVGGTLVDGSNMIIDQYEYMTKLQKTKDGYLLADIPQLNPLTGYYEGDESDQSSGNPYGLPYMFAEHGNERNFSFRKGNYWQLDGNYTLSLDEGGFSHMFKAGFEGRLYEMHRHYNSLPWDGNPFFDVYTDEWGGNLYTTDNSVKEETSKPYKPYRGSLYVLDQITYKGIIFTPGIRFEFFVPNSDYRTQSENTFIPISSATGFASAETKFQVSPRINITYPITDRSNVSIAYGLYFKMPELQSLYDAFAVDVLRGNATLGDPNMEAQRTNAYQVAYNNQISDDFALTISAYYRDVYNQLGQKYIPAVPTPFYISAVTEYGNAKGIEFTLNKRLTDHFGFTINYTLSQAVGTSSAPGDNYNVPVDPYTNKPSYPLSEFPMDYDRRHRVNAILNFAWGKGEGPSIADIYPLANTNFNLTGIYQTGSPYTPYDMSGKAVGEVNSERGPSYWSVDFRFIKGFRLSDIFGEGAGNSQIEFFLDIYNLLNRTAVTSFYVRTGDPDDDGVSFYRSPTAFSATTYYKEADYGNPSSFSTDQYDMYGNRLYNENCDFDGNGLVTQLEKFESYINYITDVRSLRANYQTPRTIYLGLMFRF